MKTGVKDTGHCTGVRDTSVREADFRETDVR